MIKKKKGAARQGQTPIEETSIHHSTRLPLAGQEIALFKGRDEEKTNTKVRAANDKTKKRNPLRHEPREQTYFLDQHGDLDGSHDTRPPIGKVLAALPDARKVGPNQWTANCPCPDDPDTGGHLSIKEADDGKVLLHCFHDCTFSEIVAAMGLQEQDLFPQSQEAKQARRQSVSTRVVNAAIAKATSKRGANRRP